LLKDLKKKQQPDGSIHTKWGRIEEAFEEGQGPHRAAEPVMMMMSFATPRELTGNPMWRT
jgi:hypothetical protein